ncbi:MAG: hypothetical protein IAF08_13980, partial [Rhizobacter sp.]|nr:hypothetical protein [Chlorobiales bacterium]
MSRPTDRKKKPNRRGGPLGDMTRIAPFLMRKGEETVAAEILTYLQTLADNGDSSGGRASSRDLAAALGYAEGDDLVGFWHVLHNLHDKNEVSKDEARNYSLPTDDERALTVALSEAKAQKAAAMLTFKFGETYTGTLTANAGGYGFLRVEGHDQDIFLPNDQLGETLDGDTLEVRIPPKSNPRGSDNDSGGRGRNGRNGRDSGRGGRSAGAKPERFEGEIVSLIARRRTEIVGTLERRNREFV